MIGRIIGAAVAGKLAGRASGGARGAMVGALVPLVARRAFGPLGLAVAGAYAAKKIYDAQKARRPGV